MNPLDILDRLRPAQARVDLDRLAANYKAVVAACRVPLMPVVKADAYGHGAVRVGRLLEALGAPLLAVGYADEGRLLRGAGVSLPIVLLAGFFPGQEPLLLEHRLTPVISGHNHLKGLLALARASSSPIAVHLKVDTGMSRLGFAPAELASVSAQLCDANNVSIEGLMTHLASADEDARATGSQLDLFDEALADLARQGVRPRWVHAANSAGISFLRPGHTLARPGLLLYGLRPRPLTPVVDVRPAMTVSARIALVKAIAPGTAVSYGGRWSASRPSRIATIPLGYADGVPRTPGMSQRGCFVIGGRLAPIVGAVCMDMTMADVSHLEGVAEGSEAVLFGDDPTAWDLADWAGTNPWHVLTSVGSRLPRVYVESGRIVDVSSRYAEMMR